MPKDTPVLCCGKCKLPIFLDESLMELSLVQRGSLTNAYYENPNISKGFDISTKDKPSSSRLHKLKNVKDLHQLNNSVLNSLESYVLLEDDHEENEVRGAKSIFPERPGSSNFSERDSLYNNSSIGGKLSQNKHGLGSKDAEEDERSKTLSRNLKALGNIFNILSSKSKIDHPLCSECCDLLLHELSKQYEAGIKERDTYQDFLKKLKIQQQNNAMEKTANNNKTAGDDLESLSPVKKNVRRFSMEAQDEDLKIDEHVNELNDLDVEASKLMKTLESLEKQSLKLDEEIEQLKIEEQEIEAKNLELLESSNEMDLNTLSFLEDWGKLSSEYEDLLTKYNDLRKINVYNEMFFISHRGLFGTINNCRIGGYENNKVAWKEINAGMGHVVLLLSCIVNRLKIVLPSIRFEPMGSNSRVCILGSHQDGSVYSAENEVWKKYNCFYDRNTLTDEVKYFFTKENDFDKSLEVILLAISEIQQKIPNSDLPYVIEKDKINGICIRLNGGQPSLQWTMACKFLLTNLKWLLAFSSRGN
ncbi:hypothetical protein ACO0QE_002436 [Hanseniaspora vineae]